MNSGTIGGINFHSIGYSVQMAGHLIPSSNIWSQVNDQYYSVFISTMYCLWQIVSIRKCQLHQDKTQNTKYLITSSCGFVWFSNLAAVDSSFQIATKFMRDLKGSTWDTDWACRKLELILGSYFSCSAGCCILQRFITTSMWVLGDHHCVGERNM